MAEDSPSVPISRDITDVPIVTSNIDRPGNESLKAAYDNFNWDPAPVEEETPPSAPVEKPDEELVEAETKQATKPETDPVEPEALDKPRDNEGEFERRVKRAPTEKEISGEAEAVQEADEIDSLDLDRGASVAQKSQFAQLKAITKRFKNESVELKSKLAPVLQELGVSADDPVALQTLAERVRTLKAGPVLPPEQAAEIEALRVISRASKLDSSLSYTRGYIQPIKAAWSSLIDDIAGSLPQTPEVRSWAEGLKNHDPRKATSEWYQTHLNLVPDGIARQRIATKIGQLSELQQTADRVATEIAGSGDLFRQWQEVEGQQYGQKLDQDVRAAVGKLMETTHRHLKNWLPRDEKGVSDPKELEAIRENNRKYPERKLKFGNAFRHFLNPDRSEATADALSMVEWSEKVPELEKKVAELEKENARLSRDSNGRNRLRNHELQPSRGTAAGKPAPEKAKLTSAKQPNWDDL
jgi:hypothetical protein